MSLPSRTFIRLAMPAVFLAGVIPWLCHGCEDNTEPAGSTRRHYPSPALLSPEEAAALISQRSDDPDFVILDVRTPEEFASRHIRGAVSIDFTSGHFSADTDALDRTKGYLVYCESGTRSSQAVEMMRRDGFTELYDVEGGISALAGLGGNDLPIVSCGCQ